MLLKKLLAIFHLNYFFMSYFFLFLSFGIWSTVVPWAIIHRGDPTDLAVYSAALSLAAMIFIPLFAPLGDQLNKKNFLLCNLFILTIGALGRIWVLSGSTFSLVSLLLVDVISCIAFGLTQSVASAMLIELANVEQAHKNMGFQRSVESVVRIVAPLMTGFVIGAQGEKTAFWTIVGASFFAMLFSRFVKETNKERNTPRKSFYEWRRNVYQGFRAKWLIPIERYWTFLSFAFNVASIPIAGYLLLLKTQNMGAQWLGVIQSCYGIGSLVGYLFFCQKANKYWGLNQTMTIVTVLMGFTTIGVGYIINPYLLAIGYFILGGCLSMYLLNGQTQRTLAIPKHFRTRLIAINMMIGQIGMFFGAALVETAQKFLELEKMYLLYGVTILIIAFSTHCLNKISRLMSLSASEAEELYLQTNPEAFNLK